MIPKNCLENAGNAHKNMFFSLQGCQVDWRFRVQNLFCKDKRGGMRNLIPTAGLIQGELGGVFDVFEIQYVYVHPDF